MTRDSVRRTSDLVQVGFEEARCRRMATQPRVPRSPFLDRETKQGWRWSSIQEAGLRGYFQSPTIQELARLLVTRAFIGTNLPRYLQKGAASILAICSVVE